MIDFPIKFPSETEVIDEEVARFRATTPSEQVRAVGDMYRLYQMLLRNAADPETALRYAEDDEAQNRRAIEEFAARHV